MAIAEHEHGHGQELDRRTIAASLVAMSVLLYIMCVRGLRVDLGQFVVCASLLMLALALLLPSGGPGHGHGHGHGPGPSIVEGFDSMVAMTTDLIIPHLDRLIIKLSNGGIPKPEPKMASIDKNWFAASGAPVADADLDATKLAYKRIKNLLCMMGEADPDRFQVMMKALGAPPVEMEDAGGHQGGSHGSSGSGSSEAHNDGGGEASHG